MADTQSSKACDLLLILVMEDDENDVELLRRAFEKLHFGYPWRLVRNGEEGIAYLSGMGKFADRHEYPYPAVILMDLKMPRVSGFDVLQWLRDHPECTIAPVIVFSSSDHEDDVRRAYSLGIGGFFRKPQDFGDLLKVLQLIRDYWCTARKPRQVLC